MNDLSVSTKGIDRARQTGVSPITRKHKKQTNKLQSQKLHNDHPVCCASQYKAHKLHQRYILNSSVGYLLKQRHHQTDDRSILLRTEEEGFSNLRVKTQRMHLGLRDSYKCLTRCAAFGGPPSEREATADVDVSVITGR